LRIPNVSKFFSTSCLAGGNKIKHSIISSFAQGGEGNMNAIVSLLDDFHYKKVEWIWAELKKRFHVEGIYITPYPHFSYQVSRPATLHERGKIHA
jgi:hypothetical protein